MAFSSRGNDDIFKKIEDGIVFDVKINNFIYEYIISYESYENLILKYEGYVPTPYVPKNSEDSGITLGYGYDLGQQSKTTVKKELSDIYTPEQIERLLVVLGKKGDKAKAYLSSISDIKISKEDAKRLSIRSKARYAQKVVDIYPESISLSNDQRGAFLSLIYNRGNSLTNKKGNTRDEMIEIQKKLKNNKLQDIPNLFRSMKRLWKNKKQDGLLHRREDEAIFFEKGL